MPPINHHSCNTEILDFWKTWICSQHVRSFLEQQKWTTSTDLYRSQMASLLLNSCPPFQRATTRAQLKLHIKTFVNDLFYQLYSLPLEIRKYFCKSGLKILYICLLKSYPKPWEALQPPDLEIWQSPSYFKASQIRQVIICLSWETNQTDQ